MVVTFYEANLASYLFIYRRQNPKKEKRKTKTGIANLWGKKKGSKTEKAIMSL